MYVCRTQKQEQQIDNKEKQKIWWWERMNESKE